MAVVTEPLVPDHPHRGLAKAIRYGKWRNFWDPATETWLPRLTAHKTARHFAPPSPYQLSVQTLHAWLGRQWYALTPDERQTWIDKAAELDVVVTTVWFAWATDRHTAGNGPSRTWPPTPTYDPIAITGFDITGRPGRATIAITPADDTALWALLLARTNADHVTPRLHTLVAVVNPTGSGWVLYEDTRLRPADYLYSAACLLHDGTTGPWLDAPSIKIP